LRLSDDSAKDDIHAEQTILTEAERKAAHVAGNILEQFLVQAARLPMQTMPESRAPSVRSASEDESALEDESDGGSGDESSGAESDGSDESVDERVDCTGCRSCCPREFALPPRLTEYILKQRKTQAKENECKRKAKK
ncbi:hypothetical protein IW136_006044, partial [Coemansia sp. RSA 678]